MNVRPFAMRIELRTATVAASVRALARDGVASAPFDTAGRLDSGTQALVPERDRPVGLELREQS